MPDGICKHCGMKTTWDYTYMELTHENGDPQCINPFTNEFMASWAENKES